MFFFATLRSPFHLIVELIRNLYACSLAASKNCLMFLAHPGSTIPWTFEIYTTDTQREISPILKGKIYIVYVLAVNGCVMHGRVKGPMNWSKYSTFLLAVESVLYFFLYVLTIHYDRITELSPHSLKHQLSCSHPHSHSHAHKRRTQTLWIKSNFDIGFI